MASRPAAERCTAPTGARRRGISTPTVGRRLSSGHPTVGVSLFAVVALLIVLTGCGTDADATADGADGTAVEDVAIIDFEYEPKEITVTPGTTVRWTNEDRFGHTVTAGDPREPEGLFDGTLGETIDGAGETFEYTFDEAGTFPYYCRFHPRMVGVVAVGASS